MSMKLPLFGLLLICSTGLVASDDIRVSNENGCLHLEVIGEEKFRARYKKEANCSFSSNFPKSAYIAPQEFEKPIVSRSTKEHIEVLDTHRMTLNVNSHDLCIDVHSKTQQKKASQLCPGKDEDDWLSLGIDRENVSQLYGLGQQHPSSSNPDGDWFKHGERKAGSQFGNQMVFTEGGLIGNTQFPILYAVGSGISPWYLFIDNYYPQYWNFKQSPMKLRIADSDEVIFYFQVGNSLKDLRKKYMSLVGKPLVPSRKFFGLWISEYGYDNWEELDSIKNSLIKNQFPLDGFVMDLQWFGGIEQGSETSSMGKLTWDEEHFPAPAQKIQSLKKENLGLILIEESYINRGLLEHKKLHDKGYLVKKKDGSPVFLDQDPWWGKGGMIDWSNPAAGAYWHDEKRQPLVDMGIIGHWTDLGEPMVFDSENGVYHGFLPQKTKHSDIHNLYNLLWHRSIYQGYKRHNNTTRPFILSRSGGPGMQRYGAGMWSGDIPAKYVNIAMHLNAHLHMVMSGIDYFSSDAGGFYRNSFSGESGNYDNLYTRWYAISALIDFPLRPHADNLCNCFHTSPDKSGDLKSNLANTRLRYELIPYYYSLAHRANQTGEPIIAPAIFADENDFELVGVASHKMIGSSMLTALETHSDKQSTQVYLPKGQWFDYRTHEKMPSEQQWFNVDLYHSDLYQLPLYAKAGAIVPFAKISNESIDAFARPRQESTPSNSLDIKIFPGEEKTEFTVFEDDGMTNAYLNGSLRSTLITQQRMPKQHIINIHSSQGTYQNAPSKRNITLVIADTTEISTLTVNQQTISEPTELLSWKSNNGTTTISFQDIPVDQDLEIIVQTTKTL